MFNIFLPVIPIHPDKILAVFPTSLRSEFNFCRFCVSFRGQEIKRQLKIGAYVFDFYHFPEISRGNVCGNLEPILLRESNVKNTPTQTGVYKGMMYNDLGEIVH